MDFIQIAESRQHAAEFQRHAGNAAGVLHVAFLDLDLVLRIHRHHEVAGKVRIDAGGHGQLGFAEVETAAAGTDFVPAGNEASDLVSGRIALQVAELAAQDQRDGRIEGVRRSRRGRCRRGGGSRGRMLLRLLEALLELADARLVAVFELFYFLADFPDFRIVRADGGNGYDKGGANRGRQGGLPEHVNLLWTKKISAPRQSRGRQRRRSEEKRRSAAVEGGKRARAEHIVRLRCLREYEFEGETRTGTLVGATPEIFSKLTHLSHSFEWASCSFAGGSLPRWEIAWRVRRLLREEQQQDQQGIQGRDSVSWSGWSGRQCSAVRAVSPTSAFGCRS